MCAHMPSYILNMWKQKWLPHIFPTYSALMGHFNFKFLIRTFVCPTVPHKIWLCNNIWGNFKFDHILYTCGRICKDFAISKNGLLCPVPYPSFRKECENDFRVICMGDLMPSHSLASVAGRWVDLEGELSSPWKLCNLITSRRSIFTLSHHPHIPM
jgi:hypothetical protein